MNVQVTLHNDVCMVSVCDFNVRGKHYDTYLLDTVDYSDFFNGSYYNLKQSIQRFNRATKLELLDGEIIDSIYDTITTKYPTIKELSTVDNIVEYLHLYVEY